MLKTSDVDNDRMRQLELVSRLHEGSTGFAALREVVLRYKQRHFDRLARRLMLPNAPPADPLQLEFDKGYWAGVEWVLDKLPQAQTKEFERVLRELEEEKEGEPT